MRFSPRTPLTVRWRLAAWCIWTKCLIWGCSPLSWGSFNQNYFAALPSLHAAWPVVVAMFTLLAFGRKAWPIIFYPGLVIIGGVYFNHHYLIDYLVSWAYLLVAFIVIERAVMPWLDRVMDYNLLGANGILSGGLSSNPRRRIAAKSDPRESSRKYLLRTMFLANVLLTIRSTCNAGNIGLAGLSKPFRYFAIFVAVCLPLVILSYTQFGGLNKAGMLNTQGDYLQQQGRQKDAIAKFDGAIGIDPQLVGAHINRGRAYFSLGQIEWAIKEFDVGIRLDPQRVKSYVARGNAYFNLGQYQRAIQDYDAGLHLDPRRTKAYLARGNSYFNLGQYQRAILDYGIAISFNVRYALAYRNRGIAFANLGQAANAKVDLDKACQLDQKYC